MSGQVGIPDFQTGGFVTSDREKMHVWYVYGREAERAGFREYMNPPSQVNAMNTTAFGQCERTPGNLANDEFATDKCGPFRMDHYTAQMWVAGRETSLDDLPPR